MTSFYSNLFLYNNTDLLTKQYTGIYQCNPIIDKFIISNKKYKINSIDLIEKQEKYNIYFNIIGDISLIDINIIIHKMFVSYLINNNFKIGNYLITLVQV